MLKTNNSFASFNQQNIYFFSFTLVFLTGINDASIKIKRFKKYKTVWLIFVCFMIN